MECTLSVRENKPRWTVHCPVNGATRWRSRVWIFPNLQNLLSITSIAATEATLIQGNLTVQLYAGLYARTQCKGQNFGFGAGETTFYATVMVGSSLVLDNEPSEPQFLSMIGTMRSYSPSQRPLIPC